jgi:hypothetical protein
MSAPGLFSEQVSQAGLTASRKKRAGFLVVMIMLTTGSSETLRQACCAPLAMQLEYSKLSASQ